MSVDQSQPPPIQPTAALPFPRLCIRDWFVLTFICVTLFLLHQRTDQSAEEWSPRYAVCLFAHSAISAAEFTVAITLVCWLVARRTVRGFLPGHWLCLYAAWVVFSQWVQYFVGKDPHVVSRLAEDAIRLQLWGTAAIYLTPAWLDRSSTAWQAYFRLTFGHAVVQLLMYHVDYYDGDRLSLWLLRADFVLRLAAAVAFIVADAVEILRRRRADWAHWVGVLGTPLAWCVWFVERPSALRELQEYWRMTLLNLS